jgi:predicted enzyme related to lactoylglutathione lyase
MEGVDCIRLILLVDDYDAAISFYCHKTGLFTIEVNLTIGPSERNVVLRYFDKCIPFRLVVMKAASSNCASFIGNQSGGLPLLVLPIKDCLGCYERLAAAGILFEGEPIQLPYGCQATLLDPFGNRLCLSEKY